MARNMVIKGCYMNKKVVNAGKKAAISTFLGKVYLDENMVSSYKIVSEENRKSAASGIAKGAIGGAILGPIGAIAGAVSANNVGTYRIIVNFKNGKRSLLEIDDKLYGLIVDNLSLEEIEEPINNTVKEEPPKIAERNINSSQANAPTAPVSQPTYSIADEILKFKQLADSGVITQEEFEKKKQQLLNM